MSAQSRVGRILQALFIIALVNAVSISGYYTIHAMLNDHAVPLWIRLTFITGSLVFLAGLGYALWDRIKTRKNETFRRLKW